VRLAADTVSGSTLHPASERRGQEWFNPLYREGEWSGLIGGGLVSACIISVKRRRVGSGRRARDRAGEDERETVSRPGGQGGATQSAHVPASLGAGDIIFITRPADVPPLPPPRSRYIGLPRGETRSRCGARTDRRLIDRCRNHVTPGRPQREPATVGYRLSDY